jgi:hypothetical protein
MYKDPAYSYKKLKYIEYFMKIDINVTRSNS